MNNRRDFTREDILDIIEEITTEANNPGSELHTIMNDMRDASIAAAQFDVNLAEHFLAIRQSFVELIDYVKTRKELH